MRQFLLNLTWHHQTNKESRSRKKFHLFTLGVLKHCERATTTTLHCFVCVPWKFNNNNNKKNNNNNNNNSNLRKRRMCADVFFVCGCCQWCVIPSSTIFSSTVATSNVRQYNILHLSAFEIQKSGTITLGETFKIFGTLELFMSAKDSEFYLICLQLKIFGMPAY